MALEPAWIGVIGTGIGALLGGTPALAAAFVQGSNAREQRTHEAEQARAKREADAGEAEAQRQHDEAAEQRRLRRELIESWRAGISDLEGPAGGALDTLWYETLRPHLAADVRDGLERPRTFHIPSDTRRAGRDAFTREVDRIEREWRLRE